ncbi:uncharacterized protein LOC118418298 isoform X2 [Branchiostoma floridae]|uniref:Uncharacterized protein LOC118418298 isoform X2 n=1 Tax=Branchiostoma floridae TaxID=7739 RepID=A0A9J7MU69_BRAFL|nr:uncharacterized protein LOC118418298 isoform X2 [Branchiostoma floridae]
MASSDLLSLIALGHKSSELEIQVLHGLRAQLQPRPPVNQTPSNSSMDADEQAWLAMATRSLGDEEGEDPFPEKQPQVVWGGQSDLNAVTRYLFERRFGWSEALLCAAKDGDGQRSSQGQLLTKDNGKFKGQLNEMLDEFLKWFFCQNLCMPLLQSLLSTIQQAHSKPVVRMQTYIHMMDWLKHNADQELTHGNFQLVKNLLVSGLTDIWSAIRNAVVARLSPVIECFSLVQLEDFFTQLVKVCQDEESSWQKKEGAVMGINAVVRRFHWVGTQSTDSMAYLLKFGPEEMSRLPSFITQNFNDVVRPLLAHAQLSIREHATKAYSSYLSRCEFREALSSFREVMSHLCRDSQPETQAAEQSILPHLAVLRKEYSFMDAYEAEGLLGVCVFLVKHIPPGFMLPSWPYYFSTFNLYLMHPASTVRQATSQVFKYLVAKDCNNPTLLKLVLQGLCADWSVDLQSLEGHSPRPRLSSFGKSPRQAWGEGGRKDVDRLSPGSSGSPLGVSPRRRRATIQDIHSYGGDDPTTAISETWEWREGRLFAYELILRFLVTNHIHYLFPSLVSPVGHARFDGMASTDDVIVGQRKLEIGRDHIRHHEPIQKSFSHAGMTLRHALHSQNHGPTSLLDSAPFGQRPHQLLHRPFSVDGAEDAHNIEQQQQQQQQHGSSQTKSLTSQRRRLRVRMYSEITPPIMESGNSLQSMVREYNYHVHLNTPFRPPKKGSMPSTYSLLDQTRRFDGEEEQSGGSSRSRLCLSSPVKDQLSARNHDDESWVEDVQFEQFSTVLRQMLYQTVECLADSRWELRRMSQQVLPLLSETIRWYNLSILEDLWDTYLTPDPSVLCFGACLMIKHSIQHCAQLTHLMEEPMPSWKDPDLCRQAFHPIINFMEKGLLSWIRPVCGLLSRACWDKLSVVAMEIIMLANCTFPKANFGHEDVVVNSIRHLFTYAHTSHPIAQDNVRTGNIRPFKTAKEGFLCCGGRLDSSCGQSNPRQVEKYVLSETHGLLSPFLRRSDLRHTAVLLPILACYANFYSDDNDVCTSMLEGMTSILYLLGDHVHQCPGEMLGVEYSEYCAQAATELADIIANKEMVELSLLRPILETFYLVSTLMLDGCHLHTLFNAISARLSQVLQLRVDSPQITDPSLAILSNDIPPSPVDPGPPLSDDDDDSDSTQRGGFLNASGSSRDGIAGMMGGPSPSPVSYDSNPSSDWDSWDEDEEDQSALSVLFSEFLQRLQRFYTVAQEGRMSSFQTQLGHLSSSKQRVMRDLLNNRQPDTGPPPAKKALSFDSHHLPSDL